MSAVDRGVALAAARYGQAPLARLVPSFRARVAAAAASVPLGATLHGREEIHASWLDPQSSSSLSSLSGSSGSSDEPRVARWLERCAEAELVDMPPARPGSTPSSLADVPFVPGPVVQRAIEDLGLAQLALALRAAPEALPRIAGHLGERSHELLAAAARPAPRLDVAAAVRELAGLADVSPLFAAGARHAGPALAALDEEARRQIAQRLPRELGVVLLAEAATATGDAARGLRVVAAVAAAARSSA